MEGDRSLIVVLCAATLWGCGVIGRTNPRSADAGSPGPDEVPVKVRRIAPAGGRISTTPRIAIDFSTYLEDDSFTIYDTGGLRSGGRAWGGWADWVMTDRRLVWEARGSVPDGLEVTFSLAGHLRSVTGAKVASVPKKRRQFRVDADRATPPRQRIAPPDWGDMERIFEEKCNECHGDPSWDVVALERRSLINEESEQVDRLLVEPYDPADSYLMQKVLWDYPDIRYSPQPPPWSGGEELSRREQRTIERWIEVGAPLN